MTTMTYSEYEVRAMALRWVRAQLLGESNAPGDTAINDAQFLCKVASYLAGVAAGALELVHRDRPHALHTVEQELALAEELEAL